MYYNIYHNVTYCTVYYCITYYETQSIRLLRAALSAATAEFDRTVKREKEMVKRLGGLYVIGTSRYVTLRYGILQIT